MNREPTKTGCKKAQRNVNIVQLWMGKVVGTIGRWEIARCLADVCIMERWVFHFSFGWQLVNGFGIARARLIRGCSDMSFSTFANVRPKRLIDSTFLMFDGFGGVIAENYWFVKIHFPLSNQQTIRFATRNNRKNIFKRFIFLCHSFQQQRKNHFHHTWFGYSHGCVIRRFHKCHSGKRANQRQEKRKKAIYFTFPPEILAAIEKCFISEFFFLQLETKCRFIILRF